DLAVLEVHPGFEVVGLTEAIGIAQPLEITLFQPVRRRFVVATDPELERDLGHAFDRLRRNPGDSGDGGLDSHRPTLTHWTRLMGGKWRQGSGRLGNAGARMLGSSWATL